VDVHIIVVVMTVLTVLVSVTIHYESFVRLSDWLEKSGRRGRQRILMMVLSLIVIHGVEIGLFGLTAWGLVEFVSGSGMVVAAYSLAMTDYLYFSAITFTTLGYGEMYPDGPIRFLFSAEALSGFALITWSASLTFIEMQRHWRKQ
jgi:hypothetical protein